MADAQEKRGPIEKGEKGWPVNPFGVVALVIFALIAGLFIVRPLLERKAPVVSEQSNSSGGRLISPSDGQIIQDGKATIELSVDEPQKAQKVQFWVQTYADGKWQMIGEANQAPYKLDWQIPQEYQNKSVAITAHIFNKDGNIIKDPGGWKKGIIILSQQP